MKQESEFFNQATEIFIFFKKEFSIFSHSKRKSVYRAFTEQDFTLLQYNSFTIYFQTFPGNFKFYNVPFQIRYLFGIYLTIE